ncbi:MAG: ABC transporter ATP-binding protein [Chloroflexi bacterium]|nr:ABC transporter ATP-binding protein [Chloroflexota bacterium]
MTAVVETRNLSKTYRLGRNVIRALDGVDLTVERGEFISIVGRSGCGKTTLLNLIGGLDQPDEGDVLIEGVDIGSLNGSRLPRLRRDKIGFIFQEFNLIPTLTALENVELPLKYARVSGRERRRRAQEVLALVGLGERMGHRPAEISGGEAQRVAVARALVNNPAVVLADEPTGELDSHTALDLVELMRDLNHRLDQTFILVTHDPAVSERTDRLIRLHDGRIIADERVAAPPGPAVKPAPSPDLEPAAGLLGSVIQAFLDLMNPQKPAGRD